MQECIAHTVGVPPPPGQLPTAGFVHHLVPHCNPKVTDAEQDVLIFDIIAGEF